MYCRYNDPEILAGQGTIALEIIEQMESMSKTFDAVVVPVGGGGLIAGISVVIKHLMPDVQVIVSFNFRMYRIVFKSLFFGDFAS